MHLKSESFVDFLEKYGDSSPPEMVYRKAEDPLEWQNRLRCKIKSFSGVIPPRVETDVRVIAEDKLPGFTRKRIQIRVNEYSDLPAYLLVPNDIKPDEKRPGLVVLHGHSQFGIDSICGIRNGEGEDSLDCAHALNAVKKGYVVLAPAWWGWPGRDGHTNMVCSKDKCDAIQMASSMYGINVLALHIQDGQAALDCLCNQPEVAPARIGCIGNSYGGRMTMWLSVFDRRIKACVISGAMNTFRERSLKLGSCGIQYFPGLLQWCDVPEILCLIAPAALQLQAGRQDPLINAEDREMIERKVRDFYTITGAGQNFDYVLNDEGHVLVWKEAERFLDKFLPVN